ncbi:hypothetical protein BABINDRAFT_159006 [Babjeviella inositovora NRRL Y-12698]|uniref:Uncharacterized protein n=1 Tax=Babjeviella inositovora NRRL Y-12698 TaxID=984486 RepID=A0A1E3QXW8_9ASCO|nr:uncharacterized protein BABINDRAFT_159006 [Babjeviella inositovora NRRL Y-12698]ODQ82404.1 hypothetical protein BABINDRAFT_159006 [Babjeviella inositovora NRRL Y-12698]
MATFITELWESVFTPGTTPALIKATHGSFVLLVLSLIMLIYLSGSIHFYNLLAISFCLWGTVTWFILELENEKIKSSLKTNEELAKEAGGAEKKDAKKEK